MVIQHRSVNGVMTSRDKAPQTNLTTAGDLMKYEVNVCKCWPFCNQDTHVFMTVHDESIHLLLETYQRNHHLAVVTATI